jgi:hypothetical protein
MNEKQIRFWSDPGAFILIYLGIAFVGGGILKLGEPIHYGIIFIILAGLYWHAYSNIDKYLTDEEKEQRRKQAEWDSSQRPL